MMKEEFLTLPFLPNRRVTLMAVDGRCNGKFAGYPNLVDKLKKMEIRTLEVPLCPDLYWAISSHPDIQFHPVGGENIVIAPNAGSGLANKLLDEGFNLIEGKTVLGGKYPTNIAYNVARLGRWAFHNLKATDPVLREELRKREVELVHIPQGYSKCSALILDEKLLITEDKILAQKARGLDIHPLLIPPGFVLLPGIEYGFIGGAGGLIDKKRLAISGDLTLSPSFLNIIEYLKEWSITLQGITQEKIVDVGSLIPLKQSIVY